ncbi:Lipoamide acyltransferase, mitochondrial [Fulvia fulva]|uniref:Dihydrolipoamide acetyltransferase component of pyruvate dehydrogenase complex n=1 Tax=Passalora fulva TaxID=5499 RepID=A0A9Q8P2F4_PASFU|nr:Lipoamide acyltransferase, mitochondrial [Fulvia fulva]KAK4634250.1 Lipoamide acyltransferase, mitochondrial [Fulvia fulva]KAK4636704.1 Lipoamide acyltransferase, mitochondrial [Fulvia fulva]UJO10918.1 Lipoamide acyltransferase, mitochondrial [Fulvia fulva]WPV10023.1 Lipoamide acyltransferase, mitochondrial [Fulvia fulva]WPV24762.1 Lipoamide acyltransferase, mitochondrial [Fulvia fulva]
MSSFRSSFIRVLRSQQHRPAGLPRPLFYRQFHASNRLDVVKPFLLADIGEGITECQLIQWFVQPGARVEQFDKLCEVQSDKASVEITSPFDGVIKKLYYDPDDMAITGKPLVDIDIQSELSAEDEAKLGSTGEEAERESEHTEPEPKQDGAASEEHEAVEQEGVGATHTPVSSTAPKAAQHESQQHTPRPSKHDKGSLATPAVRHLVKEHNLEITNIQGSGKDGRVMKEDVQRHVSGAVQRSQSSSSPGHTAMQGSKEDRKVSLTPVQNQMFKAMTRSLNIPQFLYSTAADMTAVTALRKKLNETAKPEQKLTHLVFIMKAVSLAFLRHPLLNASLNTKDPKKPELLYKGSHNFGIAIDSPSGLLVPVVKNVQDLSIVEIAAKMRQLSEAARSNKLAPGDFSGATFTVSNIGSVGGGVVSPVISEPQVGIVGVGRSRIVPAFDENEVLIRREELVFSWSADHRVVDGAECARCAEKVKSLLEEPASMLVDLR